MGLVVTSDNSYDDLHSFVSSSTISNVIGYLAGACPGTLKALRRIFTCSPGVSAIPFETVTLGRVWPGATQPYGYEATQIPLEANLARRPFQMS